MTTRILPPDEWPRLAGTEAETLWPHLDPSKAMVIVVEQDGQIVGTWTLMHVLHAECVWIAPAQRKRGTVARRLWGAMLHLARGIGARTVVTAAMSDEVRGLMEHIGATKIPGEHYAMRIESCQPSQQR